MNGWSALGIIDVVLEAETLENVERVRRVAHVIGVPADGCLPGGLLNALNAFGDEPPLRIRIEEIAVLPGAAVRPGLMAALHDLASEIGHFVDGLADHEGREFYLMFVHQVKDSGDALVHAVLEETIGRQIGQTLFHWFFDEAWRPGDRLTSALKHK